MPDSFYEPAARVSKPAKTTALPKRGVNLENNRQTSSAATLVLQAKRGSKKKHWNEKQKAQNQRLFEKRAERQQRYAQAREREQQEDQQFIESWYPQIEEKAKELLNNKEVLRAIQGHNLDPGKWQHAVGVLEAHLKQLHSSNAAKDRQQIRTLMEAAWTSRTVGRRGEERQLSTMPPKIWYTTQEIFDAKAIYLRHRFALTPGGDIHGGVLNGKKPDYFTSTGVGDAQNVDAADVEQAMKDTMGTITSKVAKYQGADTTVVVGVHNSPDMLEAENINTLKAKINELENKPARVFLVSGSTSVRAYP